MALARHLLVRHLKNPRALLLAGIAVTVVGVTGCDLQEGADLERGEALFTSKCGSCHALTAAGTSADIGPNLDFAFKQARADGMDQDTIEGVVQAQIENPRDASPSETRLYMPANLVEGQDADNVAAYIASVAGVEGIEAPVFVASEFFATNCGSCHVLAAAGTLGQTGPVLDDVLPGQSAAQISESISAPQAQISAGFPPGVMPANFGDSLTDDQLQQLVQYLTQSVGGGGGASGGGGGASGGASGGGGGKGGK